MFLQYKIILECEFLSCAVCRLSVTLTSSVAVVCSTKYCEVCVGRVKAASQPCRVLARFPAQYWTGFSVRTEVGCFKKAMVVNIFDEWYMPCKYWIGRPSTRCVSQYQPIMSNLVVLALMQLVYVSVHVSLEDNDYYSRLVWPFKGNIIQLLNHNNEHDHHTCKGTVLFNGAAIGSGDISD